SAAAMASISSFAQQAGPKRRIGVLIGLANDSETQARIKAFEQGLEREGWAVGKDVQIEYRFAAGSLDRMQVLAKGLAELRPDVILGHSTPVVSALANATRKIPIVFVVVSDPIGSGFVASMARPGGNITGFTNLQSTISGK